MNVQKSENLLINFFNSLHSYNVCMLHIDNYANKRNMEYTHTQAIGIFMQIHKFVIYSGE